MRILFLLPVISLLTNSDFPQLKLSSIFETDTTAIIHLLDGNTAEWPQENFAIDKGTKIRYAIDNDSQMLFLALNISDKTTQQRIMQKGMRLFIDGKGKKKENRGVEFPLGMENVSDIGYMKIFGFSDTEPFSQSVKTEGTINIAIGWDSSYALCIEYHIPLKILGAAIELNNKTISIGWKLQESGMPGNTANQTLTTTTGIAGFPSGSRLPANRNASTVNNNPAVQSIPTKAGSFWTSHTIIF